MQSGFRSGYSAIDNVFCLQSMEGPTWLSGKVFDSSSRDPGFERTRSSGFFRGSVLGQDTSEPSLVLVKPVAVI